MIGKKQVWKNRQMIRMMEQEFHIEKEMWTDQDLKKASRALFVFPDVETFLSETGWEKDNPEYSSETYLTSERICRWVDGKLIYFSRLMWEEDKI